MEETKIVWLTIIVFAMYLYSVQILYFHDKQEETGGNKNINKSPVINKNNPLSTCHIVKGKI